MDIYRVMKLLSDPTRMKILFVIYTQKSYVNEIVDYVDQSQANVSKHLRKLKGIGIIKSINHGNKVLYQIDNKYLSKCIVFNPLMEMYSNHEDGIKLLNKINKENNNNENFNYNC